MKKLCVNDDFWKIKRNGSESSTFPLKAAGNELAVYTLTVDEDKYFCHMCLTRSGYDIPEEEMEIEKYTKKNHIIIEETYNHKGQCNRETDKHDTDTVHVASRT